MCLCARKDLVKWEQEWRTRKVNVGDKKLENLWLLSVMLIIPQNLTPLNYAAVLRRETSNLFRKRNIVLRKVVSLGML